MSGRARMTVSPSSSSTMRSTPCVEGCCGPMFSTIVSAAPVGVWTVVVMARRLSRSSAVAFHGIILAQRMAFPVLRHEDAPQVGVAFEPHAEQVKDFALVPVGSRPDRGDGFHRGVA